MKKVGIVGLGLIGGSIARAIKKSSEENVFISAFDTNRSVLQVALFEGVIDAQSESIKEITENSDLIVVATPLSEIENVFAEIGRFITSNTVVTDVASLKVPVIEIARRHLPEPSMFVGGHPMAGSERGGYHAGHHELFSGRVYIVTPVAETSERALKELHWLIKSLKAKPVSLSPEEHDRVVAYNSHLTHVVSWALINVAFEDRIADLAARYGGPSFRDITRVAMSPADLWINILSLNRENVSKMIRMLISELEEFRKALECGDISELRKLIEPARDKRAEITRATEVLREIYRVEVVLPNIPGQLARVTTELGRAGINIENIEMTHGEGEGLLFVDVSGIETAEKASDILKAAGFEVTISGFKGELE